MFDPDRLDARDEKAIRGALPIVRALNARYLKLRVDGIEHVERVAREPALFVSNHNGGITGPDLLCTLGTLWETLGPSCALYALAHDFAMRQLTPFGRVIQKFGAIRAHPENASRALASGAKVLVYPGGDLEAYRHFRRRHEIVLGERTGFVRVAQRAGAPIVPIVAHGAHRSAVIVHDGEGIARLFELHRRARVKRFPIALALPWGVALGPWAPYLPLPFPIRLRVLPPMRFAEREDPANARERVRAAMQAALDEMAGA
ncbi:MAG TPA: 1-acyl-sn-glycerol-3-phosphate acyltransferase [Polyangiaceae bacterium]|nr:1-acyl-sn-glycerol-3-phosphate acyltransferase [Polyangiaceae bacterium]